MKISDWTIRKKFRAKITTVDDIPGPDERAWENVSFEKPADKPWIREQLLKGDKRQSANSELRAVGIMQFDLFYPLGSGTKDAETVAANIEEAFAPDTVLEGEVRIDWSNALNGRKDPSGAWYHIPIQIGYTVYKIN